MQFIIESPLAFGVAASLGFLMTGAGWYADQLREPFLDFPFVVTDHRQPGD